MIPGGTSTGSKRTESLWGSADPDLPTRYESASGCRITLADGRILVDTTSALGAVALGYAFPHVVAQAHAAALAGNVAGLAHPSEGTLAERLRARIPCAEAARFLKSGAEGMAAAVRIARTATGRTRVVGCGYFGWLDWGSSAAGVPAGVRADYSAIPFDDIAALERAVHEAGPALAAIAIEPVVERAPSLAWLQRARALATASGAVLIFDEMKTGVRTHVGGYQAVCGVTPDLAVFGKALANGFPLSAVVGRAAVMAAAERTWISSTLAGETVALAAAHAVLDVADKRDIAGEIAAIGERQMRAARDAIAAAGLRGAEVLGIPAMWLVRFADAGAERRWLASLVAHGVCFKRGAYNYPMLAHDAASLDCLSIAMRAAAAAAASAAEHGAS